MEKIIHSFSTLNLHGPRLQVLDLQRYGAHATRNLKLVRITGSSHHFSGQGSSNTLTDCPRSSSQFLDKWMDAPSTQHNLQVVNMLQTGSVSSVLAREMNAGLVGIRHKGFSDVVLRKPFSEAVCFKGRSNGPMPLASLGQENTQKIWTRIQQLLVNKALVANGAASVDCDVHLAKGTLHLY